jgi:single-stranded DNA-binding protein
MSNQQNFPDWVNDAAGALKNGAFPHHNVTQRVGQVCPNNFMEDGYSLAPTSNGGNALRINLKTVFDSGRGKPVVSYITVMAFGKTADNIVGQLAPGDIVAVEGRLSSYKAKNGQYYPQIVVDDYHADCFWWIGEHAIEQHDDQQQGNGGGGRGNGGGNTGRSGYGNRGGNRGQQGGQQGGGRQTGGNNGHGGSGGGRAPSGGGDRGRQAEGNGGQSRGTNQQGAGTGGPNRGRGRDYDQPAANQQGRGNQQGGNGSGGYDRGRDDSNRDTSSYDTDAGMPIDEDDIPF